MLQISLAKMVLKSKMGFLVHLVCKDLCKNPTLITHTHTLSPFLSFTYTHALSHTHSLYISFFHIHTCYLSLFFFLSFYYSFSLSFSLSLSLYLSVSISLSLSLSFFNLFFIIIVVISFSLSFSFSKYTLRQDGQRMELYSCSATRKYNPSRRYPSVRVENSYLCYERNA